MHNDKSGTALVTGATGFVGSHLVRRLVADGWKVHVIVRPQSDLLLLRAFRDSVSIHEHDGSTERMFAIMQAAKPSVVFHLASMFTAEHKAADIAPMIHSNVLFGTQLLESMVANGVSHLVNTGTSWQHFENKTYSPVCLYAATKQAYEMIVSYYTEALALKVITLKLFDTYGPDDPRPKLFSALRTMATGKKPMPFSPGEQLIDLVYIDDVVHAYLLAAERLQAGQVTQREEYAVSSGNPVRLRELVQCYERVTGVTLPIEWGKRAYRHREVMVPWNQGRWLPGWQPQIKLEEGIRMIAGPKENV
jgi:nucleoside-diphosphate-sugar epimerase